MERLTQDLHQVIETAANDWTRAHYALDFPKPHNDAYAGDPVHPAVVTLVESCREIRLAPRVYGWNVSCDARRYRYRATCRP